MAKKNGGPALPKMAKVATFEEEEKPLPRMYSVQTIIEKKYKTLAIPPEWVRHLGEIAVNFKAAIQGESGSGKTTFVMRLCKMLAPFGKVYYNSKEEGESKTIQVAFQRSDMHELGKGAFMLGDRHTFQEMVQVCAMKRGPQFIVLDSVQALKLTQAQYMYLVENFPKKAFIFIMWEKGVEPEGDHAKAIKYLCDLKIRVKDGVAVIRSRYGLTEPYEVYPPRQTVVGEAPEPKAKKAKKTPPKQSGGPLFPGDDEE